MYFITLLFFIVTASDLLGWQVISNQVNILINFLPTLFSGIFLFAIGYYIANFVHRMDGKVWVGELVDTQSEDVYAAWLKIHDSLSYVYDQDIQKLSDYCLKHKLQFDQLFRPGLDGQSHPPIIRLFTQGEITLETVTILDILTNFMKRADKLITETILWPSLSRKLRKYRVFLQIDRKKMKEITLLWFTN